MKSVRLFIGVSPGEQLAASLAEVGIELENRLASIDGTRFRILGSDRLHLTVCFLGNLAEADAERCRKRFGQLAGALPAFAVDFDSLGCFPERGPVRIIWAGPRTPAPELIACRSLLAAEFAELGADQDPLVFRPHITLARVRECSSPARVREAVSRCGILPVHEKVAALELFLSKTLPTGAKYRVLERLPLNGQV